MITAAASAVVLATTLLTTTGDPCRGVVDATSSCTSPAHVDGAVKADAKPAPAPLAFDPSKLSGELAFASLALALGGGAAFAVSYANAPQSADEARVRDYERIGGVALFATSALVASSAAATAAFDPSSGEFRLKKLFEGAD